MGFEMHVGMKISMLLLKEKKYVNNNKEENPDREKTDEMLLQIKAYFKFTYVHGMTHCSSVYPTSR